MTKPSAFPPCPVPLASFPRAAWKWENFTPEEMACKDGSILIHAPSIDKLQALRRKVGKPMVIHSAYRSEAWNRHVGGAAGSMHLAARAFDVDMTGHDPQEFEAHARACGFTGFGFYPAEGFLHIDTGPAREWGDRWPAYDDDAGDEETRARVTEDLISMGFGRKFKNPLKSKQSRILPA